MVKLKNFSATQFTDFARCKRYWFIKNIDKVQTPMTKALALGNEIHAASEHRINTGSLNKIPPELLPYAKALEPHFPAAGVPKMVEAWMRLPTHLGIDWIGKVDLTIPSLNTIKDWKSTSSIAKYAKPPADLMIDLQLCSYGEWGYRAGHLDPKKSAHLELVYVQTPAPKTKLPQVKAVAIDVSREHVRAVWDGAKPQLDDMVKTAQCASADDVTPTTSACGMYGGCPFQSRCGIDPYAGLPATSSQPINANFIKKDGTAMGFMDRLNATKAAAVTGNGHPAPAAPPQQAAVPPVQQAAVPPVQQAPVQAAPPPPIQQVVHTPVAPPPAAPPSPVEVASPPAAVTPDDAPPRDQVTAAAAAPAPETPAGRRPRRTKAEMEAARALEAASANAGVSPVASPSPVIDTRALATAPVTGTRREFVIYLDCYPTKGAAIEPTLADDWFGPIEMDMNEIVSKENNLPTYWLLPFGEQKALLSLGIQDKIKSGLPTAMIFKSGTNIAREVLPMLIPHATQVVQAVR